MQLSNYSRPRLWLIGGFTLLLSGSFLALSTPKKPVSPNRVASHTGRGWTTKVSLADALRASHPDVTQRAPEKRAGEKSGRGASMPVGGRGRWKQLPEFHRQGFESAKAAANSSSPRLRSRAVNTFRAQRDSAAARPVNGQATRLRAQNYEGLRYNIDPPEEAWQPPDPVCAAGPQFILEAVNDDFTVLDKKGKIVLDDGQGNNFVDYNSFFSGIAGAADVDWFDPRCLYDAPSGRFWMCVAGLDFINLDEAWMAIAVSDTADPRGTWTIHASRTDFDGEVPSGDLGDFPDIGIYGDFVVVSFNQFDLITSEFQYAKLRIFSKSALMAPAPVTFVDLIDLREEDGSVADTLRTCKHRGTNDFFYLVSCKFDAGNTATVWRLDGTPTAPELTATTVFGLAPYGIPPSARQPGAPTPFSDRSIDTSDARLQNAVVEDDQILTAHATAWLWPGSSVLECAIHWMQIDGRAGFEGVVQQGIYGGRGFDYYYPALDTSESRAGRGVAMVFARSSPREFPGVRTTSRTFRMAAGQLKPSKILKAGNGIFDPDLDFIRWGDYFGADRDPQDPSRVVVVGQYSNTRAAGNPEAWATRIGIVKP